MDLLQHKRADVDLKEIEEYVMEQRITAVKGSPSAREGWVREGQALTAVTYPAANVNPLGAPSVSTTTMTVDLALQMANTIVRKINQRAVEVLDTAVTANSRSVSGHSWSTVVVGGSSQSAANLWPARDFGAAQLQAEQEELGIVYDLWILNPAEMLSLATVYGPYLQGVLQSMGIDIYVTNRVAAGTAYVVAQNQVGEMRIEKPLSTETWRESGRQVTWVQSDVRPLFFVDNPFAVLKFTGLT
jgi:hypothetical protein